MIACLALTACGDARAPADEDAQTLPGPEVIALNNRGVGEMGYFDYGRAQATFREVVARAPGWLDGRVNLAIATLNNQRPGEEALVAELLRGVLAEDPAHLRARYMLGILSFNGGAVEEARSHFAAVVEADPDDAYATYFFGQTALQAGEAEMALAAMERAIALDPYLRSAAYGAFVAAQQLGRREEAREFLQRYQDLEKNPRSRLAEIKYTRMGPRASALPVRMATVERVREAPAPFPRTRASLASGPFDPGPLSAAALDDGRHRWLAIPDRSRGLIVVSADGATVAVPVSGDQAVRAVGWGDLDNDGLTDLYLGRSGDNRLLRQTESGWEDVTERTATALPGSETEDVLLIDADHDGDLDLFVVNADGPNELLNNDGDGTFRPLAADRGLGGSGSGGRVTAVDLDGDRDDDLLVSRPGAPPEIYLNDRLWRYTRLAGPEELASSALLALDLGADGRIELCGFETSRLRCVSRSAEGWETVFDRASGLDAPRELAAADFDADGEWEFLVAGDSEWAVVEGTNGDPPLAAGAGRVVAVDYPVDGSGPSLVLVDEDGALARLGPVAGPYLTLAFSGREDAGRSMRSNASGLGTGFVVRSGSRWTAGKRLPMDSGPGASLLPLAVGVPVGGEVDYVEIDWTDGVFQTELALEASRRHRITETQRQLASCPVLFAWDGEGYRFLSDVLGVGGIGFAVGPGVYGEPRPWEHYRIDGEALAPRDGAFELRLTEPMEEAAYVDRVVLAAYDHPEDRALILDERMATGGPEVTGAVLLARAVHAPARALDGDGADVLDAIGARDGRAAPPGPVDSRFLGLLARPQVLTLEFDRDLDAVEGGVLIMDGWIEYGYSQTSFAAWQAGLRYEPPTLAARGADGRWQVVAAEFGYPAGMPRESAMPLPPLPPGTRALRLRTNQEIYFDRLAVASAEPGASPGGRELALVSARVERIGFPRRIDGPQRRPDYDYDDRAPFWDTRYQRGFYTRLGAATELVADRDNALAIIGPGDALVLRFEADLPPPAEGLRRSFVVRFDGWAKDMDLYTLTGDTLEPIPSGSVDVDRTALNDRYNTRFQSGR